MINSKITKTRPLGNLHEQAPSLVKALFRDVFDHWIMSLLAILAVGSSMLLANTSHDVRRAVAEFQALREEQQQQEIEWQVLRLEMTSLSETDRISRLAKNRLKMINVTTRDEKIITL